MLRAPFVDVLSLHCNPSALPFKGLLLLALAKLFRKGLVIRTFGGDRFLERGTPWRRAINRFILRRSDIYLAQTQEQQRLCLELGIPHPQWFPTSRPLPAFAREGMERPGTCRRFVFAGHVRQAKGIGEILEAGERFDSSVGIDVYGQLDEDFPEERFHSCHRVRYCGHIPYHQVPEVLTQYGALLLPTYHWGEGYPGIIIEAFQAGLPVICTRWLALPELVGDDCGILIKPQDAGELHDAMKRLVEDDPLYLRLCEGALRKGGEFSSELWAGRFVEYCRQAARKRAPST
jgi:glycosyltransferase involved in cell wall biosynthesis